MVKNKTNKNPEYYEGVGRRKTSIARVRIYPLKKDKVFWLTIKTLTTILKTRSLEKLLNLRSEKLALFFTQQQGLAAAEQRARPAP